MGEPARRRWTYEEYLALERDTGLRHEFVDGEVRAMSGGSLRHSAIKTNLARLVGNALVGGPCRTYDSDAKIRVLETGLASYADLTVVCGRRETDPADRHALTNPTALFEVLSPGTEAWDRGGKFLHAQRIPVLRLYVLVSPDEPRIELYERLDGEWRYAVHTEGEVELPGLGVTLRLDEVYADLGDDEDSGPIEPPS
jgi:Uma2 family endonuclease